MKKYNRYIAILLLLIPLAVFAATLLDSYSETNQDNLNSTCDDAVSAVAQGFTTPNDGISYKLNSMKFYLSKTSVPVNNMRAKLYAQGGTWGTNAVPTGSALDTSADQATSILSGSFTLITFSGFTGYSMSPNTHYMAVFDCDLNTATHFVNMGDDRSSPTTPGNWSQFFSGTWHTAATVEAIFYVYGDVPTVAGKIKVPDLIWWN